MPCDNAAGIPFIRSLRELVPWRPLMGLVACFGLAGCMYTGILQESKKSFVSLVNEGQQMEVYYLRDKDELPVIVVIDVIGDGVSFDGAGWITTNADEAAKIMREAIDLGMETYEIRYLDGSIIRDFLGYALMEPKNLEEFNEYFAITAQIERNPDADSAATRPIKSGAIRIKRVRAAHNEGDGGVSDADGGEGAGSGGEAGGSSSGGASGGGGMSGMGI